MIRSQNQSIDFQTECSNPKTNQSSLKTNRLIFKQNVRDPKTNRLGLETNQFLLYPRNKNLSSPSKNQSIVSHLLQVITFEFCRNQRIVLHLMHSNGSKAMSGYNEAHQQYSNQEILIPRAIHQFLNYSQAFKCT